MISRASQIIDEIRDATTAWQSRFAAIGNISEADLFRLSGIVPKIS